MSEGTSRGRGSLATFRARRGGRRRTVFGGGVPPGAAVTACGRPEMPDHPTASFRLPAPFHDLIGLVAEAHGLTRSQWLRMVVTVALRAQLVNSDE